MSFFYFLSMSLSRFDYPANGCGGLTRVIFYVFFNWFFLISSFKNELIKDCNLFQFTFHVVISVLWSELRVWQVNLDHFYRSFLIDFFFNFIFQHLIDLKLDFMIYFDLFFIGLSPSHISGYRFDINPS
jgi:hypothetical protein